MRTSHTALTFGTLCLVGLGLAPSVAAQDVEAIGRRWGTTPPPAYYQRLQTDPAAYQFGAAWRRRAHAVMQQRGALRARTDITRLNAGFPNGVPSRSSAQAAGTAVTGTFAIPLFLGGFANNTSSSFDSASYQSKLFGTATAPPYTVSTYYDEISRGMLTLTGTVFGWFAADSNDTYYEGSGQGLNPGTDRVGAFLKEIFDNYDGGVDFGAFDNDGPDGVPNSGDDDGIVDFVAIIFPEIGGNCASSTTNIWPHRWVYRAWPCGPLP